MSRKQGLTKGVVWFFRLGLAALTIFAFSDTAGAAKFKTIHSFCNKTLCIDGSTPESGLVEDQDGNLYGTTYGGGTGGSSGLGTVYRLAPKAGGGWTFSVVYSFCSELHCIDGVSPSAPLIIDVDGNLYGTTLSGGAGSTIFVLKHNADRSQWTYSNLYTFCLPEHQSACDDGQQPTHGALAYAGQRSGAFYNGVSPLYGMTFGGGIYGGVGVAYSLEPKNGKAGKFPWIQKVLHTFCSANTCPNGNRDLYYPFGGLAADDNGNLFGLTSESGGPTGGGGIFELVRQPHGGLKYSVLKYLAGPGYEPTDTPLIDGAGNLYFTAKKGGPRNWGLIYQMTPAGKNSKPVMLYGFCATAGSCTDGGEPLSGLVQDNAGNLFGTTHMGGTAFSGVVFELPKFGTATKTLHSFCSKTDCADGAYPEYGNLLMNRAGHIFGVTSRGGAHDVGTVFEIVP